MAEKYVSVIASNDPPSMQMYGYLQGANYLLIATGRPGKLSRTCNRRSNGNSALTQTTARRTITPKLI